MQCDLPKRSGERGVVLQDGFGLSSSLALSYYITKASQMKADLLRHLFPRSSIWLTGHSLGGAVASLVGVTLNLPTVVFATPGEATYARRIGLPLRAPSEYVKYPVWHFGTNGDPVFMGRCYGPGSSCYMAGFAIETGCHLGSVCVYNASYTSIYLHRIGTLIDKFLNASSLPLPLCQPQLDCSDCFKWIVG